MVGLTQRDGLIALAFATRTSKGDTNEGAIERTSP